MFEKQNVYHYLFAFSLIIIANYVAGQYKQIFIQDENNSEKELIQKYLLNDSPLYGYKKPKIWIHTKYDINARKWKDFMSRNTTNLNQPYIHLTIQSIIDHCGEDFHICLIDDETFSKIIPSWDIDIYNMAEPMKSYFRELGMVTLIYLYGGMTLPDSFLCIKNMKPFYEDGLKNNMPFVCESINRTMSVSYSNKKLFIPDTKIMGANKNDPVILEFMEYLKKQNSKPDFTSERQILGDSSQWLIQKTNAQKMNLMAGETIGIKNTKGKQILLEDLFEEKKLDLTSNCIGIYIPEDELLLRRKYQWFAYLNKQDILNTNVAIAKYIHFSKMDADGIYNKNTVIKSKATYL